MGCKVLVGYASEFGSTAAVAAAIGEELRAAGADVDVQLVVDAHDLGQYGAVVVGSPIYNGAWLPEAVRFVQDHAAILSRIPVAYFVVSATMRQDTPRNREGARSFLDPLLQDVPAVRPVDIGLFAGSIDPGKLPWPVRLRMWLTTDLRRGDFRRWEAIRAWSAALAPRLLGAARP
jgi:menaquinone-dependent protoporphyrinogen oxidase